MSDNLYYMGNHALPSTGLPTKVTTSTAAVVMLQLAIPSSHPLTLVEWGIDFDGSPSAIQVQVRSTSAAASATNMTAGSILAFNGGPSTAVTSSTSTSCFYNGTSTAAPTATVSAIYDSRVLSTNTYDKFWPLGREPVAASSAFVQICVLAAAAVNATCYLVWRE